LAGANERGRVPRIAFGGKTGADSEREGGRMKILVTGGAGFIGSHIVEHFQRNAEVRVLDNLRTGTRRNLHGLTHDFVEGSITDRGVVRAAMEGIDYVFHLAAMISVPESMQKPVECVEINTIGTLIVLEEAARAGVRKLCFSSSAAIYGDNPVVPKVETMSPEPRSPYAITKLDGEFYCAMFQREGLLETACLRYFNVFGPRQDPRGPYAAAVPIFIESALAGLPITIFGDGGQTRDFVNVKDVVAANAHFATTPGLTGVINVARGGRTSIEELANRLIAITGSKSPVVHQPVRAGDVTHSTACIERLLASGFSPAADFEESLAATVKWFAAGR
jgi:UDP-glucose 4-epimerase